MTFWDKTNLKGGSGFMLPQYGFKKDFDSNYYNLPPPPVESSNNEPSMLVKIFKGYASIFKSSKKPPPFLGGPPKKLKIPTPKEIKYGDKGCIAPDCSKCSKIPDAIKCGKGKELKKVKLGDKEKDFDADLFAAILNPKLKKNDISEWTKDKKLRNRARNICNTEGNKDSNYKDCCRKSNGCKNCKGPLEEIKCKNYDKNNDELFKNKYLKYNDELFKNKYLKYKGKYLKFKNN
jgi:hypothetical protein